MATAEVFGRRIELRFDTGEVAGALGDSVTVLPVVVALGALTDASLGLVLLGFAVFQAVWGLHYGLPISVEPMKALAGLAIAGTLGYGELVATALLVDDLYARDVSPDELAGSMGVTNLLAVPLGGVPMCHGSGGLAGKHAFGARTAGANLVLAALYAGAALVAGLWSGFPMAVLGVLLVIVAAHLGRVALESVEGPAEGVVVVGTGVAALVANVGIAFLLAAVAHAGYERLREQGG